VRREMKEISEEVRALAKAVQQLLWEQKHDRDMAAQDRENLMLSLENYCSAPTTACPRPL